MYPNSDNLVKLPDLSRVSSLPAEIRALIFQYVVTSDSLVTYKLDPFFRDTYTEAVQPPLTRVSRQIRAESLPLFYEHNEFVLHSEASKCDDARRWLLCNAPHLARIGRISFWLRYNTLERFTAQGAYSVAMERPRRSPVWKVDEDCRWITVVRKPADLPQDVDFIVGKLRSLLEEVPTEKAGPNDYYRLMTDLRMAYLNKKTSPIAVLDSNESEQETTLR